MIKKTIFVLTQVSIISLFLACGGTDNKQVVEPAPVVVAEEKPAAESINGEEIYKNTCVACHQVNGEGIASAFPPLANSDFLPNREDVIRQVIEGKTGEMTVNGVKYNSMMPPQNLNDQEIAAVLSYVYSSWGNTGNPVTVEDVKAVRAK